ncbi:MAG: DUF1990 domain-containing protein [Planctomycetia bacterium]|nr:DUF1990 domain-containing protein [Planctomycetia bacterium]
MWHLRKPQENAINLFLDGQRERPFSYPDVEITRGEGPMGGYDFDHNRVLLGHGEETFERACAAIRRWEMFPRPWTQIVPPDAPIEQGAVVAVLGQVLRLWWLNACRIVYVVDEAGPPRRFGFAYGTLPGHVESGEEYFGVELRDSEASEGGGGEVWYEIRAYSRPNYWMVQLAYPITRRSQRRFARDSLAAMQRSVHGGASRSR